MDVPLLIAHRGASGQRPEHTLAGYELAARMGADFIEPDLVTTADGVLVARHEPEIGGTTDIADHPEFADRRTSKIVDGERCTGWFVEDLTLAELKTLRAKERIPLLRQRNTIYDRRFPVPTFDEILQLRARLSGELGREIGVYPETKNPSYFAAHGCPLEPALVDALDRAGLNRGGRPGVRAVLRDRQPAVAARGGAGQAGAAGVRATARPADLEAAGDPRRLCRPGHAGRAGRVAGYADAIGPEKDQVIGRAADGSLTEPTPLVAEAHAVGLRVHAYTFRNENHFLPTNLRWGAAEGDYGDSFAEYAAFFAAGVDGVFTDNTDTAFAARVQPRRIAAVTPAT